MAEDAHGGAAKLALRRLGVELVVPKGFEHHTHMRQVLFTGLGEDQVIEAPRQALPGGPAGKTRPEASNAREGWPKLWFM